MVMMVGHSRNNIYYIYFIQALETFTKNTIIQAFETFSTIHYWLWGHIQSVLTVVQGDLGMCPLYIRHTII